MTSLQPTCRQTDLACWSGGDELRLDEGQLIGKGKFRACYRHPFHADRCVKIERSPSDGRVLANEFVYFQRIASRRTAVSKDHFADCHGWIRTNQGAGLVFDLVRSELTGEISPTVGQFVAAGPSRQDREKLLSALVQFRESAIRGGVPIRDMHLANLCLQECSGGMFRIVAVDGVGHRDLIPVVDYCRWLARRKIIRHLRRHDLYEMESMRSMVGLPAAV